MLITKQLIKVFAGKTSSIHLKIDPLNLNVTPECQFLGAEWSIAGVREKFQGRYEDWNENLSLYQVMYLVLFKS